MKTLSICIPTFNRAAQLERSLYSILSQPFFIDTPDIEVVVFDNGSTQSLATLEERLTALSQEKIKFFRVEKNLGDSGFEQCLRLADGIYRKLVNDTKIWEPGSLEILYELVKSNIDEKPVIFIKHLPRVSPFEVKKIKRMEDFVRTASFQMTSIGAFGIWAEDLSRFTDFSRYSSKSLVQVDVLLRNIKLKGAVILASGKFFSSQRTERKKYSLGTVFGENYLTILAEHADEIGEQCLRDEKRNVFCNHILPYYFNIEHDFFSFSFDREMRFFKDEPYFAEAVDKARMQWLRVLKNSNIEKLRALWRKLNNHNATTLKRWFDISVVTVGNFSYGPLDVRSWGHPDEALSIGSYCSISEDVRFILGGNHNYLSLTTFPLKVMLGQEPREAGTKGEISIGDDVWIGTGAVILSGVKVGQGAIIGAAAVVSRDVPPYAIVVGNPARIVKFRFSPEIVERLLTVDFGRLKFDSGRLAELYKTLTVENLDGVIQSLSEDM